MLIPVKDDGAALALAAGENECGALGGERVDADARNERDGRNKATKHQAPLLCGVVDQPEDSTIRAKRPVQHTEAHVTISLTSVPSDTPTEKQLGKTSRSHRVGFRRQKA